MKQLKILAAVVYLLAACNKQHSVAIVPRTDITAVFDVTDTFVLTPIPDPILALYNFEMAKDQAAFFRLVLLTDKKLNPAEDIHLDGGVVTEEQNVNDEVDFREQLILSFYDEVRRSLSDFGKRYAQKGTLGHSECFATIAAELRRLDTSKASQRMLIVYSDLQENSDVFNCYSKEGQKLLNANPIKVGAILLKHIPLPDDLTGITVYFVYGPTSREQDKQFWQMATIYERFLKDRGARVVIQATNKSYEP
jgi:hypothetical protein